MKPNFQIVYARLLQVIPSLEKNPHRALQAIRLINEWIADCDVEKDIIPTIDAVRAKTNGEITTPNWFTKAIHQARDKRLNTANHQDAMRDTKYKTMMIYRKCGRYINAADEKFIKEYEETKKP
jgi:hypothetical protein